MSALRLLVVVPLAVALAGAEPVLAKDACVQDSTDGFMKFTKLKLPKKAAAAAPVHGLLISALGHPVAAVTGTAFRLHTGQVEIGLVANGYGELGGQSATGSFLVDDTLTGSGFIDSEGDGDQDTPLAWEAIDCDLLPYPPP